MNPISGVRRASSKIGQQLVWSAFSRLYLRPQPQQASTDEAFQLEAAPRDSKEQFAENLTGRAGNLNVITRAEAGNVLAAYSFRFVALPWTYFHDSMAESITIPGKQFAVKLGQDAEYRNKVITEFFTEAAQGVGTEGFEYLREELFHHEHLRHSSLWVFSQGFAMLLRFASTYIAFKRLETRSWKELLKRQDYMDVNRFLFNLSFTAAYLKSLSFPVIEGYAHYPELKNGSDRSGQIQEVYGAKAAEAARIFDQFEQEISLAYGQTYGKPLVEQVARTVVDLPIGQTILANRLSYSEIRQQKEDYEATLRLDPFIRLKHLHRVLLQDNLPNDPDAFYHSINEALETSGFEKNFSAGLLWYFTRPYVPDQLVWFIITRLLISRFGARTLFKIIWDIFSRGGTELEHHAYSIGFPALRMYAPDGNTIIYDPALELFASPKPESGEPAKANPKVTAVEFGFRGYRPQILEFIQLQTVIIHFIIGYFFNYSQDDLAAYRRFMLSWIMPAGNYPENLDKWLDRLSFRCDELAKPLQVAVDSDQNPLTGDTFQNFISAYEELFWDCQQSLSTNETQPLKEAVLLLGDGLYMHGLL